MSLLKQTQYDLNELLKSQRDLDILSNCLALNSPLTILNSDDTETKVVILTQFSVRA